MPKLWCTGRFGRFLVDPHANPHFDEYSGGFVAETFGTREWFDRYQIDGAIVLGHGGGAFDEHAHGDRLRKEGKYCATLVADSLGVTNLPVLKPLLDEVIAHDGFGRRAIAGNEPFLGKFLEEAKRMYSQKELWAWCLGTLRAWYAVAVLRQALPGFQPREGSPFLMRNLALDVAFVYADSPDKVAAWKAFVDFVLAQRQQEVDQAIALLKQKGDIHRFKGRTKNGEKFYQVAVIVSDSTWLSRVFYLDEAGRLDALIQFAPVEVEGRTLHRLMAFTNKRSRLSNRTVIEALRRRILERQPGGRERLAKLTSAELQCEAFLTGEDGDPKKGGDPFHYYHAGLDTILNGALSNETVPVTPIDPVTAMEICLEAYSQQVKIKEPVTAAS